MSVIESIKDTKSRRANIARGNTADELKVLAKDMSSRIHELTEDEYTCLDDIFFVLEELREV